MITKTEQTFHLKGKNISYIMVVNNAGHLLHVYFGKKLRGRDNYNIDSAFAAWTANDDMAWSMDIFPQEYPSYGRTDLRYPAYSSNMPGELKYEGYEILENETSHIEGMPSVFAGDKSAQTLKVRLADKAEGIEAILSYTVFDEYDVILRSVEIRNISDHEIVLNSVYSASLDLPQSDYDLIYFPGAHARERELCRQPIMHGIKTDISNARGGSGHSMNPFIMVAERGADEEHGCVYGFSLIYSGNHSSAVECDQYGCVRIRQGINPFMFEAKLKCGEVFATPQCVLTFSSDGIGAISRELSNLYRANLCRSKWVNRERPILINNWEATYFDFNEEKLLSIADKAHDAGIELFVLDDGWFGQRDDDLRSLGDWFVYEKKLPSGIGGLAEKINKKGLKFGLWFEPEMVNPDSELYRAHPDWVIRTESRQPLLSRNQLILDLTHDEVCDYIVSSVCNILSHGNIEYVKWDMNRPMTDMPRLGFNHEYTLGFYKIMDAITSSFPDILFEGCSGGGGRFDAGVLAYMPQIWTSDNTDAVSRLRIQYSTSMGYPISSISAHVTAVPNHQTGRVTPLATRADTAYAGIFGYELDITKMSDDEFEELKKQVKTAKELRSLIIDCDFYRLMNPYESNYCAWEALSKDCGEVFVFACKILSEVNTYERKIKLRELDSNADYIDKETGAVYHGDELMYLGITPVYSHCDFASFTMRLTRVSHN